MNTYRKFVEVRAFCVTEALAAATPEALPGWIEDGLARAEHGVPGAIVPRGDHVLVRDLEAATAAAVGDWIVREPNGALTVVAAADFDAVYAPVEP